VSRLIRDLDNDDFKVRENAVEQLAKLGETVVAPLRDALEKSKAVEQKRRLQFLLEDLDRPETQGETLRRVRAVEVVERLGTPDARRLLESWASGTADGRLTREAKAALVRQK